MSCPLARLVPFALIAGFSALGAQTPAGDSVAPIPFQLIGSDAEDRHRTAQMLGRMPTTGWLLRTASTLSDTAPLSSRDLKVTLLQPYADLTWNSDLPFSLNDGVQWAGRGVSASVAGGVTARYGRFSMNFVPTVWRTENRPVFVLPPGDPERKGFSSPWLIGPFSADLPLRFGYRGTTAVDFGESAIWWTGRRIAAGLSNESQWWGPGIRNAIVMSNNAGGFPHAFVRTAAPIRVGWGLIEGRWILGGLSESRFFDNNEWNDLRSLNGLVVTLAPAFEPDLTAGIARVVYSNVSNLGGIAFHAFDIIGRGGDGGDAPDAAFEGAAEQITSLFARWVFPASGAEVYGEWARLVLPSSLRDLWVAPQFTQAFTLGAQWVTPRASGPRYRMQVEVTNLEQSPKSKGFNTISYYTSRAVRQGYTQRGQVIGAAIGPGSSSQWVALDRLASALDIGLFAGRIRWQTDAYYTQSTSIYYLSYDASLFSGARVSVRRFGRELMAEFWAQRRYNYLFQNELDGWSQDPTFDKSNTTLRLRVF